MARLGRHLDLLGKAPTQEDWAPGVMDALSEVDPPQKKGIRGGGGGRKRPGWGARVSVADMTTLP